MQKNYSIEIVDGIAVVRSFKKPDLSEALTAMKDVSARGDFRLRLWVLEDGIDLRNDEIAEIGRYGKIIGQTPSKAAIVVPDELSYGIIRVLDVFREQEHHQTEVFRSEQEALVWLKGE